ncbi:unnamed protein product, partial [Urochloa humidicola]
DPDPFGAGDRSSAASPARPPSKEVEEGGGGSILSPNGAGAVAAPFFPACSPSVILTSPFESKVLDPETGRRRFPRRGSSASINETQDMTESNFCHSRPGCKFRCSIGFLPPLLACTVKHDWGCLHGICSVPLLLMCVQDC